MHLLVAALLIAADQASKLWAKTTFEPGGSELELGLGFSLTYTRNSGAAFGMFRDLAVPIGPVLVDGTLLLGLLSAAVGLGLLVYLLRHAGRLPGLQLAALTLIFAGAIGNMIDRLALGYVVDWVHFQVGWFDFPVFNLADACVVAGAFLLLASGMLPEPKRSSRWDRGIERDRKELGEPEFFRPFDSER